MPVTARLSKLFYERLGESVTNELVDWFNQVDAAYKSDLKELNDRNWARFEARLDQRLAEVAAQLDGKIERTTADLRVSLEKGLKEQTRFLFGAWAALFAGLLAAIIPLWFR